MCPDDNEIAAMLQGFLEPDVLSRLQQHLDGCPRCLRLVVDLAHVVDPDEPHEPATPDGPGASGPDDAGGALPRIGRYELLEQLGRGGQGIVYAAYDPQLSRRVALKIVRPGRDPARLQREARALASLSHAHVVPVFEVGPYLGGVYMVTELVVGGTVADWIARGERQGGHPWQQILEVYLGAGRGLAAAHRAGLVHRDVKPANLLRHEDGRALLTDFGLAETGLARPDPAGTPIYMAPELIGGQPADARSDQFAFCVSLFEALHGRRPFPGKTLVELRLAMDSGQLAPQRRSVPASVARVVRRGLAADPAARHPDMDALLEALREASRPVVLERPLAVGALSVLGIAGALAVLAVLAQPPDEPAHTAAHPTATTAIGASPPTPQAAPRPAQPPPAVLPPVPLPSPRPRRGPAIPVASTAPKNLPIGAVGADCERLVEQIPERCEDPACHNTLLLVMDCYATNRRCQAFQAWATRAATTLPGLELIDARSSARNCPPDDAQGRRWHFARFGFQQLQQDKETCLQAGVQLRKHLEEPQLPDPLRERLWAMQHAVIAHLETLYHDPEAARAEAARAAAAHIPTRTIADPGTQGP